MPTEKVGLQGRVTWELRDDRGNLKFRDVIRNLVVDDGLELIADLIIATGTAPTHMAIGSDGTAADPSDSALGSELARVAFTSATAVAEVVTWVGTYGAGVGTGTVQEAGIFNAGVAGTLLAHTIHGAFAKGAGDTLTITWELTLAAT